MINLKCKRCEKQFEVDDGAVIGRCPYCGTTRFVSEEENEKSKQGYRVERKNIIERPPTPAEEKPKKKKKRSAQVRRRLLIATITANRYVRTFLIPFSLNLTERLLPYRLNRMKRWFYI